MGVFPTLHYRRMYLHRFDRFRVSPSLVAAVEKEARIAE